MPKYKLNRKKRKQALEAFTACLPKMWDGNNESRPYRGTAYRYICLALEFGVGDNYESAVEIIERSLGDDHTYETWLSAQNGVQAYDVFTTAEIQGGRIRLVESCIEALQKSLA